MKVVLGMFIGLALASTGFSQEPSGPGIKERRENQQDRIASGIHSGQLTAGEADRLETQESRINRELHAARKANGGNLTNNEKAQVNRQLNRESARIYNKRHNGAMGPR